MDKKKISNGLRVGAIIFAALTLIMFCYPPIAANTSLPFNVESTFEYAFKMAPKDYQNVFHYNAIYIVSFVMLLIALVSLVGILYMQFTGKGSAQIKKSLVIGAAAALLIVVIFAFCAKGVMIGELYKNGATKEMVEYAKPAMGLALGSIGQGVFGLLGAGSLGMSYILDK